MEQFKSQKISVTAQSCIIQKKRQRKMSDKENIQQKHKKRHKRQKMQKKKKKETKGDMKKTERS